MQRGMRVSHWFIVLIPAILCSCPLPASADDVESGCFGGRILPVDSNAIRMESEVVDVHFVQWSGPDGHAQVRVAAEFVLVNDSNQPHTIMVSFPNDCGVSKFSRMMDGKELKVDEHAGQEFGNTSTLDFAPGQTRHIKIKYTGRSEECSADYEGRWMYILQTGANWKGKISRAVVNVHFPATMPRGGKGPFDFDAVEMSPAGFNTQGRTATWEFDDFEPSQDILLKWCGSGALAASDPFKLKSTKEAAALLMEQGDRGSLRQRLGALAAVREFFPDSPQAKRVDFEMGRAFMHESLWSDLNSLYANEAIARYEAALKGPLKPQERNEAMCDQFLLCCVEVPGQEGAQRYLDRIRRQKIETDACDQLMRAATMWALCARPENKELGITSGGPKALRAYEAVRRHFPNSDAAKTIDYDIAGVCWQHRGGGYRVGEICCRASGVDPNLAVEHYQAALKQPLSEWSRREALVELFMLYSSELPCAEKATECFERLAAEKIDANEIDQTKNLILKVAAVSPAKAQALHDAIGEIPNGHDGEVREIVARLLKTNPDGVARPKHAATARPARALADRQPTTAPAGEPRPAVGVQ